MGCFFGCFRTRDDHRPPTHLISEPLPSNPRDHVVSWNRIQLSSLLISDGTDGSPCKDKEHHALGSPQSEIDVRELKDEAKFLKACGTLPETPAEIRKLSEKLKDSSSHSRDSEPSEIHSWLPNTSIQKLNFDKQQDQPPASVKLCEKWVMGPGSSVHIPSSCTTVRQNTGRVSISSTEASGVGDVITDIEVHSNESHKSTTPFSSRSFGTKVQGRNKSVHFDCESDVTSFSSRRSSSEIASQNSKQSESAGSYSVSKPSPCPTPLRLSDEMLTPGTVFPAYLEKMAKGKNPRIRSQYVYSVLNAVENFSQWEVLKEEDSNSNQLSGYLRESLKQAHKMSPNSEVGMIEALDEEDLKVEASLSSWLKSQTTSQDGRNRHFSTTTIENANFGRNPGDRPILGTVAAHWNEDEPSRISPKWWDGNGIPNSTNKYKEDQKVSWHATPFEERLEKALSEETSISQRKHISGTSPMVDFDEKEECDTAFSELQSLTHFKSG